MTRALLAAVGAAAIVLLGSIGSASAQRTDCPSSNRPNELLVFAGSGQTAQLGTELPAQLQAQLANKNGCPVTGNLAGINVDFSAPGSGASGIFAGSGSRKVTVGTDAQGVATAPAFTANFTAGAYTVDAHSDYGSVEFFLSNTASGLASGISATSGSGQEATVFSEYPQPLQARVTDANGNPVQGAGVSFAIVPGSTGAGATFLGAQASATTNSDGVATSPPLLANGSPGRFTAVASTDGLASVATYTLDNHAAAQTLTVVGSRDRSATIGTAYGAPLTARLVDATGQPVEGGSVTFTIGAGGVFADGANEATALTDANGVATSPAFMAGDTAGAFTATATAAGAAPLVFSLRNLAAKIRLVARSGRTTVGRRYRGPLTATVRDNRNRPIASASVVFTVASSTGASATFPDGRREATVVTAVNGRAAAPPLVANDTAGAFSVTAGISGSTVVRVRLQNLAGRPARVTAGVASGESTPSSSRFPVSLAVTVADRYGNRVVRATVTFSAPSHGASGSFRTKRPARTVRVRTNANGIAVAPPFTANAVVGGYLVRASVKGAHASFALVNTPR